MSANFTPLNTDEIQDDEDSTYPSVAAKNINRIHFNQQVFYKFLKYIDQYLCKYV